MHLNLHIFLFSFVRGGLFSVYFNIIMQQHCQLSHRYLIATSTVKFYKKHMEFIFKIENYTVI